MMTSSTIKRFLWQNRAAITIYCAVIILVLSQEAFATPNSGSQGPAPSGGGGKSSVPAPFGFLFLSMGAMLSSALKRYLPSLGLKDVLVLVTITTSIITQLIDIHTGLLLAMPVLGMCFAVRSSNETSIDSFFTFFGITVVATGIFVPEFFVFSLCAWITFTVLTGATARATKTVLTIATLSTLLLVHPLVGPVNLALQENFAYLATALLQVVGLPVVQQGHEILGLTTTISVTQACVGTSVVANTVALCAFISVLFLPLEKQLKTCMQMIGVIMCLNVLRIAVITVLGDFYLHSAFSHVHDILGMTLACVTYLFIGGWVYRAWQQSQQASKI